MDFFYPNFQNDMWRIMGMLFFADKNAFVDSKNRCFHQKEIERFASEEGIALYDTAQEVRRLKDNASDNFLEIVQPTKIEELLQQLPHCRAIATTGEKATVELVQRYHTQKPMIGEAVPISIDGKDLMFYRMPSTSRAYPLAIEQKAAYYHAMFGDLEML